MSLKWLGLVAWIALLGGMPFVNSVQPFVLGFPLTLAWAVGCTVFTFVLLVIVYALDPANRTPGAPR